MPSPWTRRLVADALQRPEAAHHTLQELLDAPHGDPAVLPLELVDEDLQEDALGAVEPAQAVHGRVRGSHAVLPVHGDPVAVLLAHAGSALQVKANHGRQEVPVSGPFHLRDVQLTTDTESGWVVADIGYAGHDDEQGWSSNWRANREAPTLAQLVLELNAEFGGYPTQDQHATPVVRVEEGGSVPAIHLCILCLSTVETTDPERAAYLRSVSTPTDEPGGSCENALVAEDNWIASLHA